MDGVQTHQLINYGLVLDGATTAFTQQGQRRVGNGEGFHLGAARDCPTGVRTEVMA